MSCIWRVMLEKCKRYNLLIEALHFKPPKWEFKSGQPFAQGV
jgi:hypothetical protein